jgi:hypothetical protein
VQHYLAVLGSRFLAHAFASVALLLAVAHASAAKQVVAPTGPHRDPEIERIRDEQRREIQLRNTGEVSAGPATDERAVKAAVKQLNEDFKRIQLIRNNVAHALASGGVLDYGRISDEAAEVKKRALRMQTYLALRPPAGDEREQGAEVGLDEGQMKATLVRLCRRIDSFVANPRFKSPGVMDVEGTARAGRDLREIISLSNVVRSSAGRLGQGSAGGKHAVP